MVALRPTRAQVVRPEAAARIIGPAYDALRPEERRQLAARDPDSFFNVVPSSIDPSSIDAAGRTDAGHTAALDGAARALDRLLEGGRYGDLLETLFLYRLRSSQHEQTAVVGDIPTAALVSGEVRPHERTRTAKEDELARHLGRLRLNSSPVGLTYRPSVRIDAVVAKEVQRAPVLEVMSSDGVHQTVWALSAGSSAELVAAFAEVASAYIVDGHHRVAASRRVGDAAFLAALVPTDQLRLLPYHRLVTGPLSVAVRRLVELVGGVPASPLDAPGHPGTVLLRAGGRWWRFELAVKDGRRLDVVGLEQDVLGPVLGIADPRVDPRLDVVPGHLDLARLRDLADASDGAGFALHPPTVAQLMAEADRGRTLPPKSTWFEPKLRSGVFVVLR